MFTGIVEELGRVKDIVQGNNFVKISVWCREILSDIKIGDSVAVNGICLTVTGLGNDWFAADVMPETMRRTNLGALNISGEVNLERALRLSDRLGGHIVSGHIDGTGVVGSKVQEGNAVWVTIEVSRDILKYMVLKGSVAIDGTSLTVAYVDDRCFKVSLIPLTTDITTLGTRKIGDSVNIECDVIGKYVEKLIYGDSMGENNKSKLSLDFLKENGFV